jgi:hypothetical protein
MASNIGSILTSTSKIRWISGPSFNLTSWVRPSHIAELSKFTHDQFDLDKILTTASTLKYSSAIQQELNRN